MLGLGGGGGGDVRRRGERLGGRLFFYPGKGGW